MFVTLEGVFGKLYWTLLYCFTQQNEAHCNGLVISGESTKQALAYITELLKDYHRSVTKLR